MSDRFERELARHRGAVYGHALRLTRSADDAEDLAQEAAIRALRGFDRFEPGTNFPAWMSRIVTNLYINRYRGRASRPEPASLDDFLDDLEHDAPSPADAVLGRALSDEAIEALAGILPIFSRVVVLVDVEGKTHDEAAAIEAIPPGTVRSRLFRGRALLRASLAGFARREGYRVEDERREAGELLSPIVKTNPPVPGFPFPSLTIDRGVLRAFLERCRDAGMAYRMGGKFPRHRATPGVEVRAVDCSGFVDEALYLATGGAVDLPEGSWYEQEAIEAAGFKQTRIESGRLRDGIVRIAFLPKSRANRDRHVVLILDGMTYESSGGVGPRSRPWDPTATGWMGRCDVYVLTAPGETAPGETAPGETAPGEGA